MPEVDQGWHVFFYVALAYLCSRVHHACLCCPKPFEIRAYWQDESVQVSYVRLMSRIVHAGPIDRVYGDFKFGVSQSWDAALQKHGS